MERVADFHDRVPVQLNGYPMVANPRRWSFNKGPCSGRCLWKGPFMCSRITALKASLMDRRRYGSGALVRPVQAAIESARWRSDCEHALSGYIETYECDFVSRHLGQGGSLVYHSAWNRRNYLFLFFLQSCVLLILFETKRIIDCRLICSYCIALLVGRSCGL